MKPAYVVYVAFVCAAVFSCADSDPVIVAPTPLEDGLLLNAGNIVAPRIAVTQAQMKKDMNGNTCTTMMHNWYADAPIVALNPTATPIKWFSSGWGTPPATSSEDAFGVRVRTTLGDEWSPMGADGASELRMTCKRTAHTCSSPVDANTPCVDTNEPEYIIRSLNGYTDVRNLWFTNFFHIAGSEYIAFLHEETPVASTCPDGDDGKPDPLGKVWRIALAYSNDNGVSWKYLGRSVEGHSVATNCDRDGDFNGAYAIYNNEIYLYYSDVNDAGEIGVGVAKAHLPTVIWAARNSTPPGFAKMVGPNTWCSQSATVRPGCNPAFVYQGWPQNLYNGGRNVASGKYYTVSSGEYGGRYVLQLFEQQYPWSTPGIVGTLTDEPMSAFEAKEAGHFYGSSLPGTRTLENNDFDDNGGLIVLFTRQRGEGMLNQRGVYRWQIYLGPTFAFKHYDGFSPTNGGTNPWSYKFLLSGAWSNLNWDPSWGRYSHPTDTFDLVDRTGMHVGDTTQPGLWWKAPTAGVLNVRFTVRKGSIGCGDGVTAVFARVSPVTGETRYMTQPMDASDVLGYSYFGSISVLANDSLVFRADKGANNACDYVLWDPWIAYQ